MSLQEAYMIYVASESLKKWNNYLNLKVNIHKGSCAFVTKCILVRPEVMLQLDGMRVGISQTSQKPP